MSIPPPGRLVDLGGRRLHVLEMGSGNPVAVLEAGLAASSVSWTLVQKAIAGFTRVVSYDRAGFGWSDPNPSPTAFTAAQDLGLMLDAARIQGPVVLAGHSFGGLICRVFQQQFPERVAGLVLIDPVVRAEWRNPSRRGMLNRGASLSRRGAMLARWGMVGFALNSLTRGSKTLPKLMARMFAGKAGGGAGVAYRLVGEVRKMPEESWPAIARHWSRPESFLAMADNLENLPLSSTQLDEERTLGDLPLLLLSSRHATAEHAREAALSRRGEHIVLPEAGHWIQLDAPDAVVEAVRRVVEKVRAS